jgi:hypothetical protein
VGAETKSNNNSAKTSKLRQINNHKKYFYVRGEEVLFFLDPLHDLERSVVQSKTIIMLKENSYPIQFKGVLKLTLEFLDCISLSSGVRLDVHKPIATFVFASTK